MKLLSLNPGYRYWLNARCALTFDSDLDEIFLGLTHNDSVFYAEMSELPLTAAKLAEVAELTRFLALHERHELALAFRDEEHRFRARRSS